MLVLSFKECCISSITNASSAAPSLFYKHSTHTQAEFGTESVIYAQSLLICVGRWQSAEAKNIQKSVLRLSHWMCLMLLQARGQCTPVTRF